jgi:hypothetical protein
MYGSRPVLGFLATEAPRAFQRDRAAVVLER